MREATFSVSIVRANLHYAAARHGVDAAQFCRRIGVDPAALEQPDEQLTGETIRRMWRELIALTGDEDFGLHGGEHFDVAAFGIVGAVLLSCSTFGQALDKLGRYTRLFSQGVELSHAVEDGRAACDCRIVEGLRNFLLDEPRHPVEGTFSALLAAARDLTGEPLRPSEVWFAHARPERTTEHGRIFGERVLFEQSTNRVVFAASYLDRRVLTVNRGALPFFEEYADARLRAMSDGESLGERVARTIARDLRGEAPSVEGVARELAMSVRNLQRELRAEGTTYQRLLDDARRSLALRHLDKSDASIDDIAFLLGFSEPSAFHRAFRRWTGATPRTYREGRS